MQPNYKLKLYQISYCILFAYVFHFYYKPLDLATLLMVIIFASAAVVFDLRPIVLPSSDDLSLVSPLLFTAGVIYGVHTIFWINILAALILIFYRPRKWFIHVFNCVQYSLSGVAGFWAYYLIASFDSSSVVNLYAFVEFSIIFYFTNVLMISTYLKLSKDRPYKKLMEIFFDRKAVLIYFTMMALGILMAIVVSSEGLRGFIIFFIILYFLSISYRSYYKMFDHFRSLSEKDELTNLFNHRYFQENLEETIKSHEKTALLLIDIDHFKIYNDTFGHPKGDEVLKEISTLIVNNIPKSGIPCRYGGEEFAVILPGLDKNEGFAIAEKIRIAVAENKFEGSEHLPEKCLTVSIGVSTFPDMAISRKQLILLADQALYKSKYISRNMVQLYTSVIDELKGNFLMSTDEEEIIQTLKTFLSIINSKDRYTYGHTERIMEYAELLGKEIKLSEDEVKDIRYGALLHDIGKVEVSSKVLNKVARLDKEEWEEMKNHVIWGEQIVKSIEELRPCLKMIRHHHERYDGKGYPDQLTGEQIPLGARILTIADSFDAMTTDRPYKRAKNVPEAVNEIIDYSGTQFDPELVKPFIKVVSQLHPELKLKESIATYTDYSSALEAI